VYFAYSIKLHLKKFSNVRRAHLEILQCYTGCFKKSFTTLKAYRNLYIVLLHFDSSKRCVCPLYTVL
jgi:hypothetical protein